MERCSFDSRARRFESVEGPALCRSRTCGLQSSSRNIGECHDTCQHHPLPTLSPLKNASFSANSYTLRVVRGFLELQRPFIKDTKAENLDNRRTRSLRTPLATLRAISVANLLHTTLQSDSRMKVKPDNIQRWCALTLEQYKDDMGRRTAAGIQGTHVIPNGIGPKEVRPHPLVHS